MALKVAKCTEETPWTSREDDVRRIQDKFANFKVAVEGGKNRIEKETSARTKRHQLFEACAANVDEVEREEKLQCFHTRENRAVRKMCKVWSTDDFESFGVLGEGAFGTVYLVRRKDTGEYVALKQMAKYRYKEKNVRARAYAERELLAEARNRWFVELLATFQDAENVYMAMEFLQGGDLCTYLEQKQRFTEKETCFYMAELLEALDVVHKSGFVHRDVKPDNVVLTTAGHLKLLDFGLCKPDPQRVLEKQAVGATRRQKLKSTVGTPQYMAPEAYSGEISPAGDIWALAILTYECLYGCVPFHAGSKEGIEALTLVAQQVKHHAEVFPKKLEKAKAKGLVSPAAEQFLRALICEPGVRLKAEACRKEPFFNGIDFSTLHLTQPCIVPRVNGPEDTSNFCEYAFKALPPATRGAAKDAPLEWANYEFDREAHELQRPDTVAELFADKRRQP